MSAEEQAGAAEDLSAPDGDIPERFVPDEMRAQLVAAEHLARYRWAAGFCDGRRVLDAGCGVGYGAELINRAGAASVTAVDVSEVAVELARATVGDGVTCTVGDVNALGFGDGSFDVVVCFEVIEHVDDPEQALDELARVLAPDGLLLVSSPNRDRYVPGNPHHRHEYTRVELQESLDRRFSSARIISQHVMLASVISWSGAPEFAQPSTVRVDEPAADDEVYLLAMAGRELPLDEAPVVALGQFAEPRRWLEHIDGQERHSEDQRRYLERLQRHEAERGEALERLRAAEQELAALRGVRRALDDAARDLGELEYLRGQLRMVRASSSWRLTAPLRRVMSMLRRG